MGVGRSRPGRALAVAFGVLTAAGLITGCGVHPGTAAIIEGRALPTSEVVATLHDLTAISTGVTTQLVIGVIATEPVLERVAAEHGVTVSVDDVKAMLDAAYSDAGVAAPARYTDGATALARYQLLVKALGTGDNAAAARSEYADAVETLAVTVNPRFGTFDAGSVAAPTAPTWIVDPTAIPPEAAPDSPAPAPSPTP